jgi:hypothetical protein
MDDRGQAECFVAPSATKYSPALEFLHANVRSSLAVNPIAAGLFAAQLVGEPITLNLIVGLIAVFAAIWIATTQAEKS